MNTLLVRLKNGDAEAFSEIYSDFSPRLYEFIYTKSGSAFYAGEVVQITFAKLWERHHKLNTEIALPAQLYRIAKTSLIDVLRKAEKDRLREARSAEAAAYANGGYERLEERETYAALQSAVSRMPPVRRKVFCLHTEEQLSYKEIALMLTISVKTVSKHMELAMKQIRPVFKTFFTLLMILVAEK